MYVHACVYVCMYVCMYVCNVCMYIHIYIYIHIYMYTYNTHTHLSLYIYIYYTIVYIIYISVYILYIYIYIYIIHAYISYIYIYAYMHNSCAQAILAARGGAARGDQGAARAHGARPRRAPSCRASLTWTFSFMSGSSIGMILFTNRSSPSIGALLV